MRHAFSLTGVLPLGIFLAAHLAMNARALGGGPRFADAVRAVQAVPALPLVEALFVFAPLVFHGTLGVWLICARKSLDPPAPYPPSLRAAMRLTAVAVLAFLAIHLPELRFHSPGARLDAGELATVLDADLSATSHGVPWRGLAYLVGTACVTFHFVCGLWGWFATTQAGRARPRGRRWAAWGAAIAGAAMWLTFANVVVLRATGARLFGRPDVETAGDCPESTP